jgi:hypothetical protein
MICFVTDRIMRKRGNADFNLCPSAEGSMMDIDESYGVSPWDDDDYEWPPEPRDDRADRQDDYEARREERRILNR